MTNCKTKCNIGMLNRRITIQQKTDTPDGFGGVTTAWSTFSSAWASIRPVSAKERFFAYKNEHNITHVIKIRYRTGLATSMRILYNGRIIRIHGIRDENEAHRYLILDCEEGVAE